MTSATRAGVTRTDRDTIASEAFAVPNPATATGPKKID
jgi:hypothetical protein